MIKAVVCASKKNKKSVDADFIINWSGWFEDDQNISIMQTIEKNSDRYKKLYLDLIHQVGHRVSPQAKKNVVDEMKISSGFSFWWMSLTFEKSPFRNKCVLNAIKLIALADILKDKQVDTVDIQTDDALVNQSIIGLCFNLKIKVIKKSSVFKLSLNSLFFFQHCKGLLYFIRHIIKRVRFIKLNKPQWGSDTKKNVFFFSNLYNLDVAELKESKIKYKQWESLPDYLNKSGVIAHFLNHYIKSPQIPAEKAAFDVLKNNHEADNSHAIIDSYLDLKIISRAFLIWFKLNLKYIFFKTDSDLFTIHSMKCDLNLFMRSDWLSSWVGSAAVANIFWYLIYEKITLTMPKNSLALYLCENQGWERALIYNYKKNVGEKIIAVPHSTVRFWDLRYFSSENETLLDENDQAPQPDCYAVNGEQAYQELEKNKIKNLHKVEALRYQYLLNIDKSLNSKEEKSILLLGDYSLDRTLKMINLISEYVVKDNLKLVYKPHPFCPSIEQYIDSRIKFKIEVSSFEQLSKKYDTTFVSNTSSVSIDAYMAGMKVYIFLDDDDFNMSPLKSINDVVFVKSTEKNINFFDDNQKVSASRQNTFFYLDPKLSLWKSLLNQYGVEL